MIIKNNQEVYIMNSRKKQYDFLFTDLNKYMFTKENIIRYTDLTPHLKTSKKTFVNKEKASKPNTNIFVPRQKDVLFWCFYIILNGKEKYLFNINNIFTVEKETKIAAIEILKSKKTILKEHKLRKTEIENELLSKMYYQYSKVIPVIGKYIVGDAMPYKYLVESIDKFYNQEELLDIIKKNNFSNVEYRNLSNGISAIHTGWKI